MKKSSKSKAEPDQGAIKVSKYNGRVIRFYGNGSGVDTVILTKGRPVKHLYDFGNIHSALVHTKMYIDGMPGPKPV